MAARDLFIIAPAVARGIHGASTMEARACLSARILISREPGRVAAGKLPAAAGLQHQRASVLGFSSAASALLFSQRIAGSLWHHLEWSAHVASRAFGPAFLSSRLEDAGGNHRALALLIYFGEDERPCGNSLRNGLLLSTAFLLRRCVFGSSRSAVMSPLSSRQSPYNYTTMA